MNRYAIVDGENVLNVIEADSAETASAIAGHPAILVDNSTIAEPGGTYINGEFIAKKPFASWIRSGNTWVPPVELDLANVPEGKLYRWNEEIVNWEYYDDPYWDLVLAARQAALDNPL